MDSLPAGAFDAVFLPGLCPGESPAWTVPCFEGPCEYTYEDADRSIVIRKITGAQSAGLLIDVQLREVAGFRAGAAAGDFEDLSSMAQPLQRRTGRRDFAAGPGISKFL